MVTEAVSERLGQPYQQVFRTIESQPLASASIAQVHAATLHNGSEVIWKERLDLGQRGEGMAFKEFTMHRDGVVLEYAFDGKSQESVTVEMPLNTIDEFHVLSNNLLRFLKEADSISNGPEHLRVMLTEVGPSFRLKMSPNKKRVLLQYERGGS